MNLEVLVQTVTVYAIPVLLAITLHEAAHGYVARMFGDKTAWLAGRITLNPIKHIDPVGTLLLPLFTVAVSIGVTGFPFFFGWAKPVPVNFANLRRPKRDMIWVAAAGPGINLAMAVVWGIFGAVQLLVGVKEPFFLEMARAGVWINIAFMAINLLPIPPLDGGRILIGVLPNRMAWSVARLEPYGLFVVIGLLIVSQYGVNVLGVLLSPFFQLARLMLAFFGLQ